MNQDDDDRSPRSQVTLRLDRGLLDRIDALATESGVDRTELVRRLLADGLAHRRLEVALDDYAAGRQSAWAAAQSAEIDLYQMLDRIAEAGVPYRLDPDALDRLRAPKGSPPSGSPPKRARRSPAASSAEATIDGLRSRYRPATTRLLLVGESSPAGGTHFYRADSNLYRAVREAFGAAFALAHPPEADAFLAWFRDLGCSLVDLADQPVNRSSAGERAGAVEAGVPALAATIRRTDPARIVVVLRRIAPAVRRAAQLAEFDDRAIDVLPFPIRQWRPVFVDQLAGIAADVLDIGAGSAGALNDRAGVGAIAEVNAEYGSKLLHEVIAEVLRRHGNVWTKASAIAREIDEGDLWRRPSDGAHPPSSQISARARSRTYADVFQVGDLGIRLRGQ